MMNAYYPGASEESEETQERNMTTEERIAAVEAENAELKVEVAELRTLIDHDGESRRQLLAATEQILPGIERQQLRWNDCFQKILTSLNGSVALGEARAEAMLPHFNELKLRYQTLALHLDELGGVVMESYSLIRGLCDAAKGNDDTGRP